MQWLTSPQNPRVKEWAALKEGKFRLRSRSYLVEGLRAVQAYRDAGAPLSALLYDPESGQAEQYHGVIAQLEERRVPVFAVTADILSRIADTDQPQGILAVAPWPEVDLESLLEAVSASQTGGKFPIDAKGRTGSADTDDSAGMTGLTGVVGCADVLILVDGLRDPGNLGTLIRTAQAVGVSGLLATTGTVDPFAPKVVRAAMGATAQMPVLRAAASRIIEAIEQARIRVVAAAVRGGVALYDCPLTGPLILAIGGEAEGLSPEVLELATTHVTLPMPGSTESLNAGVAASVLLYEALRQRIHAVG
ncbi:MAG: RNA methyltransferase [Firmicutes bacterium]|nr:RNA methyltransferase [Bacillota bacterium]